MAGKTGYTAPTNSQAPAGPAQMTTIYQHFDSKIWESVANAAALPSTGNAVGRLIVTVDTGALYVCTATPGTWMQVHRDTGWVTPPAFSSGWTNHDAATDPVRIRIHGGTLMLSGRLAKTSGAGELAFTLPAGYRPSRLAICAVPHNSGVLGLWVGTDGQVIALGSAGSALSSVSVTIPPLPLP